MTFGIEYMIKIVAKVTIFFVFLRYSLINTTFFINFVGSNSKDLFMFEYINGEITSLSPAYAVLDVH